MKGLRLDAGVNVTIGKRPATIVRVLDLDSYLVRFESEEHRVVGRKDIDDPRSVSAPIRALDDYSPKETEEAYRWWEVLKPLLTGTISRGEKSDFIIEASKVLGVDRATVYRRVKGYTGSVMSLLPKGGQGARGQRRMSAERDALLDAIIRKHYLVRNQPAPMTVYKEHLEIEFAKAGLRPPVLATFYARIAALDPIEVIEARQGKRASHDAKKRLMGSYAAPLRSLVTKACSSNPISPSDAPFGSCRWVSVRAPDLVRGCNTARPAWNRHPIIVGCGACPGRRPVSNTSCGFLIDARTVHRSWRPSAPEVSPASTAAPLWPMANDCRRAKWSCLSRCGRR